MKPVFFQELRDLAASSTAFRSLLLTDSCVLLAELCVLVVLPWWVTSSGGVGVLAIYSTAAAIAALIVVPVVSPFGDRFCKARQIMGGLAALMAIALALILVAALGVFSLPLLIFLAVLQVIACAFVDPARSIILAELLAPDQLPAAIRIRKTLQAVSGILGPLVAGLALSLTGVFGALCAYAALLVLALFFAAKIPQSMVVNPGRGGFRQWGRELRTGMAAKWRVPMERGWTLVNFVVWIFQGPAVGMLVPIKVQSLGLAGNWLGYSLGALSAGVLLGSAFGSGFLVDQFGRYRVRVGLGFCEGISLAVVGYASSPYVMVAGLTLAGFCNASMALVGATHRALAIPKPYRVRMFAASSMTTQVAGAIGPALVGMALATWGVDAVYGAFGLLMATSVLGFLFVPRLKEFLSLRHTQTVDWYAHQYPKVFK